MQDTRRDHGLKVTGEGKLLVGHAGAVLLRKLADPRTPDKIAWVRAKVRAHIWSLIAARPTGFPWLEVAGKLLAGWLVIDLDGTLITARRPALGTRS